MSAQVFPDLIGLGFDVVRTPRWNNTVQRSVSGKTVRIAYWNTPIWTWELKYEFLRSSAAYEEWQDLVSFFNSMKGGFDTFQFNDVDDNAVIGQGLGIGAGSTTNFQLVRSLGGFTETVYAPDTGNDIGTVPLVVYVNGVAKTLGVDYNLAAWDNANPGMVIFNVAPTGTITADFNYYWPCRFTGDSMTFHKFMNQLWRGDGVRFESIK